MSKRLDSIIPELIDSDQTGIRVCQTQDNIRRSRHIIHKTKMNAALVSVDAEKVFDCFSWEYLFVCLVLIQFSAKPNRSNNIKTSYSAPTENQDNCNT